MKAKFKLLVGLMALVMAFGLTACGGAEEAAEPAEITVPDEIKAVRDEVGGYAEKYAADLTDAGWGDKYVALLESGEAREYADYDAMKAELDAVREECGATYVYVLTPAGEDGKTPDTAGVYDENGAFLITVDGSEDPDDWGVDYGWEIQFTEAWEGATATARSAWINDEAGTNHDVCWSGFAPIYDGEGNVVCLLGIDYPCADVLNDMPEWNRDTEEFNGYEGE